MLKYRTRTSLGMSQSTDKAAKLTNKTTVDGVHMNAAITSHQYRSSNKVTFPSISDKVKKNNVTRKSNSFHSSENSMFQGNDLDVLLKSVKSSISNQFTNKDVSNDILSVDNPFTVIHPTSFPKLMSVRSPNLTKPKAKKPKLHVMMRKTTRKKKKKPQNNTPGVINNAPLTSTRTEMSATLPPKSGEEKFVQRKSGVISSPVLDKRIPFTASLVQPSKILALSRLNVINSGVSVDGLHYSGPSTDLEQSDWSDKRSKKQHRLLYQKSKHKNIVDSAFAADLDSLVSELNGMSICENPADNYIRVRPGEMPLPSIFRVIKIDLNRKMKDKILIPEVYGQDKIKPLKTKRDTPSQFEFSLTGKLANRGRKKSCSDQPVDQREQLPVCDSSDQCLPPKKRHRLMNIEESLPLFPRPSSVEDAGVFKKDFKFLSNNQKEGSARKSSGTEESKSAVPGRPALHSFGQELTVDISRESDTGTPLLSPSPGRLSTRSATLPSPSPTGSSIFRTRYHSRSNFPFACVAHIVASSSLSDRLSCDDCRLLEQSRSPGRSTLRSLSVQISDSSCSSEPSPLTKHASQVLKLQGRSTRKRRKSSNRFVNDSDSSPPRLEKTTMLSPDAYLNSSTFSEPPEITCSTFKRCMSPRWQSSNKAIFDIELSTSPSSLQKKIYIDVSPGKMCLDISPHRVLKQATSAEPTTRKLCTLSLQATSKSVVWSPSDYEPLPLDHCTLRKLVEEIQAASASHSDDDSSDMDEYTNNSNHPLNPPPAVNSSRQNQLHHKQFQSVGLFSDFYKVEKPRRSSENSRCRNKLVFEKEDHMFGLMPQPLHIGQFYMRQIQDFQLPYDIWWQYVQQQLSKKSERKIKSPIIKTDDQFDVKVSNLKLEVPSCGVTSQQASGGVWEEYCPNRDVNGTHRTALITLQDSGTGIGKELTPCFSFEVFSKKPQQECSCGSSNCTCTNNQQRNGTCTLPERAVDDCKDKRKPKLINKKIKEKVPDSVAVQPPAKPMTFRERCYARKHRTFLVRNVDKVRNQRNTSEEMSLASKEAINALYCNRLNAFSSDPMVAHVNGRAAKTRLAAYSKDNPELARRHQLAQIFDKMLTELMSLKDEDDYNLVGPLMSLPSHKKEPQYYQVVREPIDLSIIKQRVKMGFYNHLSSFNADMMLLFSNVELYCSSKSYMGQVILKLRQVLDSVKADMSCQIDELLGPNTTRKYMDSTLEKFEKVSSRGSGNQEEDIIRCVCGVTRDEGLMLQCEKCMIWQHCDCVRASGNEDHYLCDHCEPRYYDPEILLVPQPSDAQPGCTHYLTFVRDDVQYAVGDCVYVMRDCKRTSNGTPLRSSHSPKTSVNPDMLDVFRFHQLWKNSKGEKFASGTPYLRPQETFHEPTRKFYHNELFRTPNFEIIPMDIVAGKCVVMDPSTYIKGRPKGFREQDVYICEYRVDKTAHLFHKIPKIWYPINTSRFCFHWFDSKLAIKRTYSPHKVPDVYKRKAERNVTAVTQYRSETLKGKGKPEIKKVSSLPGDVKVDETVKNDVKLKAEVKVHVNMEGMHKKQKENSQGNETMNVQSVNDSEKRKKKKQKLDRILIKLLSNLPGKLKVDLTYLLDETKRIPKKVAKRE